MIWFAQKIPWLRRAYVLPQLLDTALLARTLVRHPAKARAMREEVAEDVPAALALLRRSYDRMKSEGTL